MCLNAGGRQDAETETLIPTSGGVFDAVAFGAQNSAQQGLSASTHHAPTLDKSKIPDVAFDLRGREGGAIPEGPHDTANIRAASGRSSRSYIAQPWSIMPQNSGKDFKTRPVDVSQPVMAGGPVGGNQGGDYIQQTPWAVRRLTPRECERLQGFPDDWTLIERPRRRTLKSIEDELAYLRQEYPGITEDEAIMLAADGPRYKALGNSMAVPVIRWIMDRIRISAKQAAA